MSKVVCFGEVLWDVFPTHRKIGGAPLNVALRLNSFANRAELGSDSDAKDLVLFSNFELALSVIQERYNNAVTPIPEPTLHYQL